MVGIIFKLVMYKIVDKQTVILEIVNCRSGERWLNILFAAAEMEHSEHR